MENTNNTWLSVYAEVELLEHESILGKWLRCREGPLRLVEGGRVGERSNKLTRSASVFDVDWARS